LIHVGLVLAKRSQKFFKLVISEFQIRRNQLSAADGTGRCGQEHKREDRQLRICEKVTVMRFLTTRAGYGHLLESRKPDAAKKTDEAIFGKAKVLSNRKS
jgi:hypothetical protein